MKYFKINSDRKDNLYFGWLSVKTKLDLEPNKDNLSDGPSLIFIKNDSINSQRKISFINNFVD